MSYRHMATPDIESTLEAFDDYSARSAPDWRAGSPNLWDAGPGGARPSRTLSHPQTNVFVICVSTARERQGQELAEQIHVVRYPEGLTWRQDGPQLAGCPCPTPDKLCLGALSAPS
ncbi:hypothetical protein J1605_006199 [Eschrichtius robustus]|uniref:Uncharacterized protein n=1 Tax=Eschrichtius robustus TaxID=9764 RepID=A0AB34H703_ESCRO|nr:hypothetical protein J1605_006199 [Eschrichtius robustus]